MSRLAGFLLFLAICTAAPAAAEMTSPFANDARLTKVMQTELRHVPVPELLAAVRKHTGVMVKAEGEAADLRVTAFIQSQPAERILSRLAILLGLTWRVEDADGSRSYVLYMSEADRRTWLRAKETAWERFRDGIRRVRLAATNPGRLSDDPISRAARDVAANAGSSVGLIVALPETALETAFRNGEYRIPFNAMPPALRERFSGYIHSTLASLRAYQKEAAAQRAALGKPPVAPAELRSPTETLGLSIEVTREGGDGERANLKVGIYGPNREQGGTSWSPSQSLSLQDRLAMHREFGSRNYDATKNPPILQFPEMLQRWEDALAGFARVNRVDVLAEALLTPMGGVEPVYWQLPEGSLPEVVLDRFCMPFDYTWNAEETLLLFRRQNWAADRDQQIPPRLQRRWLEAFNERGRYSLEDLAEMAVLNDGQQWQLTLYAGKEAARAVRSWRGLLRFFHGLSAEQRATAQAGELGVDQLTLAQKLQLSALAAHVRPGPMDLPRSPRGVEVRVSKEGTDSAVAIVFRDQRRHQVVLDCRASPAKDPFVERR